MIPTGNLGAEYFYLERKLKRNSFVGFVVKPLESPVLQTLKPFLMYLSNT